MKTVRVLLAGALACYALGRLAHRPVKGGLAAGLLVGMAFAVMLWVRKRGRRRRAVARLQHTAAKELGVADTSMVPGKVRWQDGQIRSVIFGYHAGAKDHDPAVRTTVEKRLGERMGSPVHGEWWPQTCTFRVTRKDAAAKVPTQIDHPHEILSVKGLPFGRTLDGKTVFWDLAGATPHGVVAGRPGHGKTITLLNIAVEATRRGVSVVAADPKRISLLGLRNFPGVERLSTSLDDMAATVADVFHEVQRRYAAFEDGTAYDFPPLLLIVDEVAELFERAREEFKAGKGAGDPPVIGHMRSIIRTGRQCRVHCLLGVQRPDAAILTGELRANLGMRVLMGDGTAAHRQMTEINSTPTVDPSTGEAPLGRCVVAVGSVETETQAWWIPDPAATGLTAKQRAAAAAALYEYRPSKPPAAVLYSALGASPEPEPIRDPEPVQGGSASLNDGSANDSDLGSVKVVEAETPRSGGFDLTASAAADQLGCSERTVTEYARTGRLSRAKRGRWYYYRSDEVVVLAAERSLGLE